MITYCFLFSEFYVPLKDRAVKILKLRHFCQNETKQLAALSVCLFTEMYASQTG